MAQGSTRTLVGIETETVAGVVGSVKTIIVELPGSHVGQIGVPDLVGLLLDREAPGLAPGRNMVKQAELHLFIVFGKEREMDTHPLPGGTQGVRISKPNSHANPMPSWLWTIEAGRAEDSVMNRSPSCGPGRDRLNPAEPAPRAPPTRPQSSVVPMIEMPLRSGLWLRGETHLPSLIARPPEAVNRTPRRKSFLTIC